MNDEKKSEKFEPPRKYWIFEQHGGSFLGWSGTEEELQGFLKDTDIMAFEYELTGRSINEENPTP